MMLDESVLQPLNSNSGPSDRLSYKFQRVRERIRQAVLTRELAGRLPGERELGKRFAANPKTVNKALGDLCCDGLLVRHIGRGTFVASDGDGQNGRDRRRRNFLCFVPPVAGASHRSVILLDAAAAALRDQRHDLRILPAAHSGEGDFVPLNAWPGNARSVTDGLLCCPAEVLVRPTGHFGDELIFEAYRRHVPMVVLGACSPIAKLNAVVPDYLGAGFRLGEYLFKMGCEEVIAVRASTVSPEAAMVVAGCRAAAARNDHSVAESLLPNEGGGLRLSASLAAILHKALTASARRHATGFVGIGRRVLTAVMDHLSGQAVAAGNGVRLRFTYVGEPGDATAAAAQITSYDMDPAQLAAWAARLLVEARPGERPVEIIVPGTLRIRDETSMVVGESDSPGSPTIAGVGRSEARVAGA